MVERWLPVSGYEGAYEVSDQGRVRSLNPPRGDGFMRGDIDRYGYPRVKLVKNGQHKRFKVHHLVCAAFNGSRPSGLEAAHLNGNKLDASATNLAWVTSKENNSHKAQHGTLQAGDRHSCSKLNSEQVREIRRLKVSEGLGARVLSRRFGVSQSQVSRILRGDQWNV